MTMMEMIEIKKNCLVKLETDMLALEVGAIEELLMAICGDRRLWLEFIDIVKLLNESCEN